MQGTEPEITDRVEVAVAIRDGLACRRCGVPLVDDTERVFVRVDPAGGDGLDNVALVCIACANAHGVHPEPIPRCGEQLPTLT
jgi:hypothetical protein